MGGEEFLDLSVSDPERILDEFLQICTVRQVRMLREIALELEDARILVNHPFFSRRGRRAAHAHRFWRGASDHVRTVKRIGSVK
jgi:hypothetical protein